MVDLVFSPLAPITAGKAPMSFLAINRCGRRYTGIAFGNPDGAQQMLQEVLAVGDPATLGEVADLLGIGWERGQGGIVGRDARMRCENSGKPSASCAASLIKERRRSSSNGSVVSTRPEW